MEEDLCNSKHGSFQYFATKEELEFKRTFIPPYITKRKNVDSNHRKKNREKGEKQINVILFALK